VGVTAGFSLTAQKDILIIEDDDATREMLATALRMSGYHVRSAADGLAGLRLLEAYEPDVVVLDLGLPIASGFDVLQELRAVAKTRLTPVIAISGMDHYLKAARDNHDFVATIPKPFEPESIVRAVNRAIKQYPV
jgi:DNA-binding response OmpR family regulator